MDNNPLYTTAVIVRSPHMTAEKQYYIGEF